MATSSCGPAMLLFHVDRRRGPFSSRIEDAEIRLQVLRSHADQEQVHLARRLSENRHVLPIESLSTWSRSSDPLLDLGRHHWYSSSLTSMSASSSAPRGTQKCSIRRTPEEQHQDCNTNYIFSAL